jgi:bifunctional ADP-heptose synthase (sugar kinase/adenylyltransferase)
MKILVIGDSCKDIFVYCAVDRFCPEVPVPILKIRESAENGGMSMNVQKNIKSLNVECDLVTNENWEKMTKSRYVHRESNHMFLRIDTDDTATRIDMSKDRKSVV